MMNDKQTRARAPAPLLRYSFWRKEFWAISIDTLLIPGGQVVPDGRNP